jgi:hypothetical protein
MNIEFHYYITYFVALQAGFSAEDAFMIAYSSQQTDDNNKEYEISPGTSDQYENKISQTVNIFKRRTDRNHIFPVFHFMPGNEEEILSEVARRVDAKTNRLNTIPDNENSLALLRNALDTNNLYRIGIATHMYADTFAHQNFVGDFDFFNYVPGPVEPGFCNIGHAHARHRPDLPALFWEDPRLIPQNSAVKNKTRFLRASQRLFEEYQKYLKRNDPVGPVVEAIAAAIGEQDGDDTGKTGRKDRLKCYKALIGETFQEYEKKAWFNEIVELQLDVEQIPNAQQLGPKTKAVYVWEGNYSESRWFGFQEAVKDYRKLAWEEVVGPIYRQLEA